MNGDDTISPTENLENGTENRTGSSDDAVSSPDEVDEMRTESDHQKSHDTKMPLDLTHSHVIEVQPRIPEEEVEATVEPGNEVELPGNKTLYRLHHYGEHPDHFVISFR